jgi:hypothetical protein
VNILSYQLTPFVILFFFSNTKMLDVGLLPHSRGLNQDKLLCAFLLFIFHKTTSEQEHMILTTLYPAGAKNTNKEKVAYLVQH